MVQGLTKEDRETLNRVVPTDLDEIELKHIKQQLAATGAAPQRMVDAVIEAVRRVRPTGKKIQRFELKPQDGAGGAAASVRPTPGRDRSHETKARPSPSRVGSVASNSSAELDLVPVLRRQVHLRADGSRTSPEQIIAGGATFRVRSTKVSFPLVMEAGAGADVLVELEVAYAPGGVRLVDGRELSEGDTFSLFFSDNVDEPG